MTKPIDESVLEAWLSFRRRGERAALVTLVNIDGSAPRPVGSQIAVSESGEAFGYITGGCAEAALAAEAVDAIKSGENRLRRYGRGSPFLDVRLPCGSGIDVHFATDLPRGAVAGLVTSLAERRRCHLDIAFDEAMIAQHENAPYKPAAKFFRRPYEPATRVEIIGKGPVVLSLARSAKAAGMQVLVASPESETLEGVKDCSDETTTLAGPGRYRADNVDEWTAAAVLFHEHDWEPPILKTLIASRCFYLGALGSRKTHVERLNALRRDGVDEADLGAINGPIGIDIHARSPEEIAISVLAEIIAARRCGGTGARWRR